MKKCIKCGSELDDNAEVCQFCGTAQKKTETVNDENDKALLDRMMKFLQYEHAAWKTVGIVFLSVSILLVVCSLMIMICGALFGTAGVGRLLGAAKQQYGITEVKPGDDFSFEIDGNGRLNINGKPVSDGAETDPNSVLVLLSFVFVMYSFYFLLIGLLGYLPTAVMSLVMLKKVEYYENTVYTDVSIARKRCTSVGMIVFAAIFNKIALIFIIINFVKTRKNAKAFDRIEAAQKGGNI